MKKENTIWWVLGGLGAIALWYYYKKPKVSTQSKLVTEVLTEEEAKYSNALLQDYNIVLPTAQASAKVKAKGEELRQGRYALQPQRMNPPLFI
jgi:hypothetical protein